MGPTPTQQALAVLALEGLGERCGRHIAACIDALRAELEPVAEGGFDVRGHVDVLVAELRRAADAWESAFE